MIEDEESVSAKAQQPANDNGNIASSTRIEVTVLAIARLIGRQMAREEYERLSAANDNRPPEHRGD
jgi:plasmid replication initiation protein